jgi:hypothetical protein
VLQGCDEKRIDVKDGAAEDVNTYKIGTCGLINGFKSHIRKKQGTESEPGIRKKRVDSNEKRFLFSPACKTSSSKINPLYP